MSCVYIFCEVHVVVFVFVYVFEYVCVCVCGSGRVIARTYATISRAYRYLLRGSGIRGGSAMARQSTLFLSALASNLIILPDSRWISTQQRWYVTAPIKVD